MVSLTDSVGIVCRNSGRMSGMVSRLDAPTWEGDLRRRTFVAGSAAALVGAAFPRMVRANVPAPYSWDLKPPTTNREAFIKWAVENRGEHPRILAARWDRYVFCVQTTIS
jgi:hypothetical protein